MSVDWFGIKMDFLDWNFIWEHKIDFVPAIILSAKISFFGILGAIIVGFMSALIEFYQVKILRNISRIYLSISLNTPLLIHLFFLYYGLGYFGLKLSAFHCAVIGVIFLGGSYMHESFLLGFRSVAKIQRESALALGLTKMMILRFIILPQSIAVCAPSLGANVIFLLKETSVVSAIALADVVFVTKDLIGIYYKTTEALFMLIVIYLILLLPLSIFFSWLERYYKRALL